MVNLPSVFASIPREPLLFLTPPPIEPLPRLTEHLVEAGRTSTHIFVKREDSNSGLGGGGGNKFRKLEYGKTTSMVALAATI